MADLTSFITIAPSNNAMFTNAINNDMLVYTESHTQSILMGTMSNAPAVLKLSSNTINVGATVVPITTLSYDLGTSNKRFRDLYLSGNTIDLGGTLLKKDNASGALTVTDSNGTYQSVVVSQLQVGNSSNVVTIQLDSNNQVQFVATTFSNGQSTGSNVASVGGWSNVGSNLIIIGSNVGVGKSNPEYSIDTSGDINFDGILRQGGVPYIGSQWSNNSTSVFLLGSNVGIGTNNPSAALDVIGNTILRSNLTVQGTLTAVNMNIVTSNILVYSNQIVNDTLVVLNRVALSNTSGYSYFDSIGSNIGLNTGSPTESLTIVGCNIGISNASGKTVLTGSNNYLGINKPVPGFTLDIGGDLNFSGILYKNNIPYIGSQWSNNSSNVFILGSNIGIGVSNPTSALTVAGDLDIRSNILLTNQQLVFRGVKILKNSNMGASINITSAVTSIPGYTYFSSNHIFSNISSAYISFVGGTTETARFTGNNRLGIGTTTPSYPLDVAGDINFGGILRQGGVPYIGSQWSNNSTSVFLLGSNVGIGTTVPTSLLHLANNAPANVLITLCNSATGARPAIVGINSTGDIALTAASNNNMLFSTSNVERMRITSNGLIGIGTTAPTSTLHVIGNTFFNGVNTVFNASADASGTIMCSNANNSAVFFLRSSNATNQASMSLLTSGVLNIDNGNRNIGVTCSNFTVTGAVNSMPLVVSDGQSATMRVAFPTTQNIVLGGNSDHFTSIGRTDTVVRQLTVQHSTGFVGIGTTAPTYALSVVGTIYASNVYAHSGTVGGPTMAITGGTGDRLILWPGSGSTHPYSIGINNGTLWYSVPVSSQHQWYINGNIGMTLSNNLLGVGTATPAYLLDVNGNGRVNGNMYFSTTGAYMSSTTGTYGTVSVSGYAKNSWYGYDINTWFCYMANNTSVGIHDNAKSWVFYYDKSDDNNRYCNLYWGGGASTNALRLQTTSYGVSVPNTLYMGLANFNINTWHTSSDGKNRFHFSANSHTYIGSPDTWRFQHVTNGDVAFITSTGFAQFNGGLNVGGGVNFYGGGYTFQLGSGNIFDTGAGSRVTTNQNGTITCYVLDQNSTVGNGWMQTRGGGSSDYRIYIDCTGSYCGINAYNGGNSARDLYLNNNGGTVRVNGTLVKGGGSFDITHPNPEKASQGYRLRHCFVESPTRGDNIYTFKVTTTLNNEKFVIDLPDYFNHLNENPRAMISCEEEELFSRCCARVNNDLTQVKGMCEYPGTYVIMVIGTRKDQMMVDYFDNNGGVEYIMPNTDPMHPNFTQSAP